MCLGHASGSVCIGLCTSSFLSEIGLWVEYCRALRMRALKKQRGFPSTVPCIYPLSYRRMIRRGYEAYSFGRSFHRELHTPFFPSTLDIGGKRTRNSILTTPMSPPETYLDATHDGWYSHHLRNNILAQICQSESSIVIHVYRRMHEIRHGSARSPNERGTHSLCLPIKRARTRTTHTCGFTLRLIPSLFAWQVQEDNARRGKLRWILGGRWLRKVRETLLRDAIFVVDACLS